MKHLHRIALVLSIVLISNNISGQGWTVNPADYDYNGQVTVIVFHGANAVTTGTLGAFVGGTCRGFITGTYFPPTGKTVFTVMCYSNLVSGEILTFRYFDPSDGSYYDIQETLGFVSDMIVGDDISPLQYHTVPLVYTVTGGGSYCQGGSGLPVGLTGSESGVTYTLYKNAIAQTPTIAGTGSAISFGNQLGGTYTVSGNNSGGTINMTGNAVIIENPFPLVPLSSSGSGVTCTQITANWSSSANATSYALDVSPVNDFSSFIPGFQDLNVGNVTTYNIPGLTEGTTYYYRVRAVNSCGTSVNSGTITYATSPATPSQPGTITGTATQCPAVTGQTYSISSVTNATTYTWTVPTGWSITAGAGTTSITVTTGSSGQNGNITVTAGNSCGTSAASTMAVTVGAGIPASPVANPGSGATCAQITANWSSSANATSYALDVSTVNTFASYIIGYQDLNVGNVTSYNITGLTAGTTYYYRVRALNSCGVSVNSGIITTITPINTITLTSGAGTDNQTKCINSAITSITYATTGAIGATFSGLSTGVTGGWLANVVTISGTPSVSGTFNYIVTLTGGCGTITAAGTITVNAPPTITGTLSFYLGSTTQLAGSGTPAASSPWISSSPSVASVDDNGLVTSVSAGTSVITYTDINGCSSNTTVTINVVTFSTSLASGWNWFSVNTIQGDMTLAKILPAVTSNGDYIKDQVSSAIYYTGYGWFGSLAVIDPTKLYKIKVQNSSSISYSGAPVNVSQTSISLVPGWNWIGYLPQSVQSIDNAFSSLSLSNLDYVKNQTKSATYYTGYGWFGSLTNLSPSEGYMIKVANAGTLKYSDITGKMNTDISAEEPEFSVNPYDYEFNGSVTAEVFVDSVPTGSENSYLLAYVNDQLRGVSEGHYFDPRGIYIFPIMIHSNISDGEIIEFKYYDAQNNKTYPFKETITFVKDMIVADAFKSFKLNARTGTENITPEDNDGLKLKTYPNPFENILNIEYSISETTHVSLKIYDTSGKIIQQLLDEVQNPDNYSVKWYSSAMPGGMYIIMLHAGNKQEMHKVTLIR